MENKIKIGITQGDINGIGYEIILKTLADLRILELCVPIIYGSPKVAAYHRKALDINVNLNLINSAGDASDKRANIINCNSDEVKVELSQCTQGAGEAAFQALEKATADLKAGLIDAIVTAPINKKNIQSDKFAFPGHTEYFEQIFGKKGDALMLLISNRLRVAVVTGHIPVAKISQTLTKELIVNKIKTLNKTLKNDFGISRPRIAVLGLNPHSGDQGVIGKEDIEIIKPAVTEAMENEIVCVGPIPADGFFGSDEYTKYDAVLAMYHDQGLIPFKLLSMDNGVNFTAGLDVVRTSPDHGTAYDIAGQNLASENSFRQALYAAVDIVKQRHNG